MKYIFVAASLGMLAGCQAPAASTPEFEDSCGISDVQHLVGTSASNLDSSTLPAGSRILRPDTVATMDYRQDRLNVHVDSSGKINRLACG